MEKETTFIDKTSEETMAILSSAADLVTRKARQTWDNFNEEGGSVYLLKRRLLRSLIKTRRPYRRLRYI